MSFALRTSLSRVYRTSVSAVTLSQRPPVIRVGIARRALQIRSMAGQSDVKLNKQTPDSKWKEILGADEVSGLLHSSLKRFFGCSPSVQVACSTIFFAIREQSQQALVSTTSYMMTVPTSVEAVALLCTSKDCLETPSAVAYAKY